MEAASKIIFDDDEDLDVQAAALQSYLKSLDCYAVNMDASSAADLYSCNTTYGIIDSGASATFVTSTNKFSNVSTQKTQLRTANGQSCFTSHAGTTTLPIGSKAIHLPAMVAPSFSEDLISVAQLTTKGNKVLFTKNSCLLLSPSADLNSGAIIGKRGSDN